MPYRTDARGDEEGLRRRLSEAEARLVEAKKRCEAAAGTLASLRARIQTERRALDDAIAAAERDQRRAIHAGLAMGGDHERVRAALRAQGAVAALQRAMAHRARAPRGGPRPGATGGAATGGAAGPPPPIEESKRRLAEARRKRARLVAQQGPALERAQRRMADAVRAHDEAAEELEAARIAIEGS